MCPTTANEVRLSILFRNASMCLWCGTHLPGYASCTQGSGRYAVSLQTAVYWGILTFFCPLM